MRLRTGRGPLGGREVSRDPTLNVRHYLFLADVVEKVVKVPLVKPLAQGSGHQIDLIILLLPGQGLSKSSGRRAAHLPYAMAEQIRLILIAHSSPRLRTEESSFLKLVES